MTTPHTSDAASSHAWMQNAFIRNDAACASTVAQRAGADDARESCDSC
jgi:hypothetical protein